MEKNSCWTEGTTLISFNPPADEAVITGMDDPRGRARQQAHPWRRVLSLAILVTLLVVIVSSETLHGALLNAYAVAERVIARRPVAGAILYVLLSALSAMLAFVSSAILVPAAIVTWGKLGSLVLLWIGWLLGGLTAYGLARGLGRAAVSWLVSRASLEHYERRLTTRPSFGMALLVQLALPSEIPGYLFGLARFPLRLYLPALAIGELPFAVGTIYLGAGFLEKQIPLLLAVGAAGILFSALALRLLNRKLR